MNRLLICGLALASCLAFAMGDMCTPDQWEGYEGSVGGYIHHGHPGIIQEWMKVSYDAKSKAKAAFISYHNNEYENKFQVVMRHDDDSDDSGRLYIVDLKTDKCWSKKMEGPFRKACVPGDAKHLGDHYMGLKGKGLQVSMFYVHVKDVTCVLSVQKQGDVMIPIGENLFGKAMKTAFIQPVGYLDITPGIQNATVFDVPKQCKEEESMSPSEYLLKEHAFFGV